jgi:hypothetical protein
MSGAFEFNDEAMNANFHFEKADEPFYKVQCKLCDFATGAADQVLESVANDHRKNCNPWDLRELPPGHVVVKGNFRFIGCTQRGSVSAQCSRCRERIHIGPVAEVMWPVHFHTCRRSPEITDHHCPGITLGTAVERDGRLYFESHENR